MSLILLEMKLPSVASPALYRSLQSLFPDTPGMAEEALALLRGGGSFRAEMQAPARERDTLPRVAGKRAASGTPVAVASDAVSAAMAAAAGANNGAAVSHGMHQMGLPIPVMAGPGQVPNFPGPPMIMRGGMPTVGPGMPFMSGRGVPQPTPVMLGGPQMQFTGTMGQRMAMPAPVASPAKAPIGYAPNNHPQ